MLKLQCEAQTYAWGRPAPQSEVAALAAAGGTPVDNDKPYAELWMGTHPSGPSVLADAPSTPLSAWLAAHPAAVGAPTAARFGTDAALPFLFKVLSVQTALSIQSHPDKKLAEALFAAKPHLYKDDNHKPEMAVALGDGFSALCGFAPLAAIAAALARVPELRRVVGEAAAAGLEAAAAGGDDAAPAARAALKAAFTALMTADAATYGPAVDALAERLEAAATGTLTREDALARTLSRQYPSDVGVLASYFLNYVALPDGAALALAANEPHAYVSGNLVECMAASDNVIRAGLTPKPRDTDALCASLTYAAGPPALTPAVPVQEYVTRYAPPFDEFEVQRVALPPAAAASAEGAAPPPSTLLPPFPGPAIVLVTGGGAGATLTATATPLGEGDGLVKARTVARGDVIFVPAATPLALAGAGLTAWIATVNGRVFGGEEALVYVAPAEAAPAATAAVA